MFTTFSLSLVTGKGDSVISSIDKGKGSDKIQDLFLKRQQAKFGGESVNLTKTTYKIHTANIKLNGGILNTFFFP